MHIGVVGLGAYGVSILKELVKSKEKLKNSTVHIFTERHLSGTGLPYQEDDESLLLNQFPETMSIYLEDPMHFCRWIQDKKNINNPQETFFPRVWFGEYLQEQAQWLTQELDAKIHFEKVKRINILEDSKYEVVGEDNSWNLDAIHLAIGHLSYNDPYHLKGTNKYIYHPYPMSQKIPHLNSNDKIAIIGTGLTAMDLMLYIKKYYPNQEISFFSKNGRFGSVRGYSEPVELKYFSDEKINNELKKNHGLISLDTLISWFIKEVENQGLDIDKMWNRHGQGTILDMKNDLSRLDEIAKFQKITHELIPFYGKLWDSLTISDKNRYLNDYHATFMFYRSPYPVKTTKKLIRYTEDGTIKVYSDLIDVSKENEKFIMRLREGEKFEFDYLFNASGQSKDLSDNLEDQDELIIQLINERILLPYKYGGVSIDLDSMSAVSQRYGLLKTFKVYGQLASGVDFLNDSVSLIKYSVKRGIDHFISVVDFKK